MNVLPLLWMLASAPLAAPGAPAAPARAELPATVPEAFAALARGSLAPEGGAAAPLEPAQRDALIAQLAAAPRADLAAHLGDVAAGGTLAERELGLALLASPPPGSDRPAALDGRAIALACDLAVDAEGVADRRLLRVLERALAEGIGSDDGAIEAAVEVARDVPVVAQTALLRALGASGSPRAATELARLAGSDSPVQLVALSELGRLLAAGAGVGDERIAQVVRGLVDHADPSVGREALLVLGRLADESVVPRLIEALDGPHEGQRRNAFWALGELTGLSFREDARRWKLWYAEELAWWDGPAQEHLRALRGGRAGDAASALQAFARHHLFRHQLAEGVADLLGSPDPQVVLLACHALRQLDSPVAAPRLERVLAHPDERVRAEARRTLALLSPPTPLPPPTGGVPGASPPAR